MRSLGAVAGGFAGGCAGGFAGGCVAGGVAGGAVCANTGPAVSTAASAAPITVIFETFIKLSLRYELSAFSYQLSANPLSSQSAALSLKTSSS